MTTTIEESAVASHRIPENRPPTHPGKMLLEEFLEPLGVTQQELADRMGVHYPRVNELVHGRRRVTTETALLLAKILGTTPELWLNLQQTWDLYEALNDPTAGEKLDRAEPLERGA